MSNIKKQNKFNYENMMKVDEKYQDLVTDIACYIRVELSEEDAEEAINDINDILLSAQDRGENLYEVVGDYQAFCKDVISSYKEGVKGYRLKSLKEYMSIAIYGIIFFIALDIVSSFSRSKVNSFNEILDVKYTFTWAPILTFVIALAIGIGLVKFIAKSPTKTEKKKRDNVLFILGYMAVVCILVFVGMAARNVQIITFEHFGIGYIIGAIIVLAGVIHLIFTSKKAMK